MNDMQIEQLKAQNTQEIQRQKTESQRAMETWQAQSQMAIQKSQMQMDAYHAEMQRRQDEQKMLLEAKLTTFEVVLKALVDAATKASEMQLKAQAGIAGRVSGVQ